MDLVSLLIGLGFLAGLLVFGILASAVLLWIATKLLKFPDSGFVNALKTTVAYSLISLVISFVTLLPSLVGLGFLSTIMGFLAIPVYLVVFAGLIESFYGVGWGKAFLAVLIVLGIEIMILAVFIVPVVLWQLGIFNPPATTVSRGWMMLQPLSPSVAYGSSGQSFTASFNNVVGTRINITRVEVKESLSSSKGTPCSASVNGKTVPGQNQGGATVSPGASFEITAECPGAGRQRGDPYEMSFTIRYDTIIGGIVTPHTEIGVIRGSAE
jgi:hypothetical protein